MPVKLVAVEEIGPPPSYDSKSKCPDCGQVHGAKKETEYSSWGHQPINPGIAYDQNLLRNLYGRVRNQRPMPEYIVQEDQHIGLDQQNPPLNNVNGNINDGWRIQGNWNAMYGVVPEPEPRQEGYIELAQRLIDEAGEVDPVPDPNGA